MAGPRIASLKIEEAALDYDVIMTAGAESRVKEYYARDTDNLPLKAHWLIGLSRIHVDSPVPKIPEIGDIFDFNPIEGVAAGQTRDGNAEFVPGHRLVCQRVTFRQMSPTMVKIVAFFADNQTSWKIRRSIEVGTRDTVLHYDLDALQGRYDLTNPNSFPQTIGPGNCRTFQGKVWQGDADPNVPGNQPGVRLEDALVNGLDGVNVPFPVYTLTVRGLYHDMLFALQEASQHVGSTNSFGFEPGHPVFGGGAPDTWLFLGVTGTEIKSVSTGLGVAGKDIWDLTWKFQYDQFQHRTVRPEVELGNYAALVDLGRAGEPWPCRSSRIFYSFPWHNWIDKAVF